MWLPLATFRQRRERRCYFLTQKNNRKKNDYEIATLLLN